MNVAGRVGLKAGGVVASHSDQESRASGSSVAPREWAHCMSERSVDHERPGVAVAEQAGTR